MNQSLKETPTKLVIEIGSDRVTLLPFVLYRVGNSPYLLEITPFEVMFGPVPLIISNM